MKLLNSKKEEVSSVDLGIVEAGKSKTFDYFLLNDSMADVIDIEVEVPHNEVSIDQSPKLLASKEIGVVKIIWSPSLTLKQGLKTLIKIKGTELYK